MHYHHARKCHSVDRGPWTVDQDDRGLWTKTTVDQDDHRPSPLPIARRCVLCSLGAEDEILYPSLDALG